MSASSCSGKEIAGLLKKSADDDDEEYDDTKFEKSRVSGFSRTELEAGRNELGLCMARYESQIVAVLF